MDLYLDIGMLIYCFEWVSIVIHIQQIFVFICASQYVLKQFLYW